jgi:hypothetical protein
MNAQTFFNSTLTVRATAYHWPPTGTYRVSVKLYDASTNGWKNGPLYFCPDAEVALGKAARAAR